MENSVSKGRIEDMVITELEYMFVNIVDNAKSQEQKEELRTHLIERIYDYMNEGLSLEDAFKAAREGLGDIDELLRGFKRKGVHYEDGDFNINVNMGDSGGMIVALSPFIYVILGITQNTWLPWLPFEMPISWWAWGWAIIPMSAILFGSSGFFSKITPLSPFIYVIIGLFIGGTWWLWGWMIIPMSGIIFSSGKKKRKKAKMKKAENFWGFTYNRNDKRDDKVQ